MDINVVDIENVTAERLRALPLGGDIYCLEVIETLEDDDSISAAEGGFMRGYLEG